MTTIQKAKTPKELGLHNSEAKQVVKLASGSKKVAGLSARAIADETGIPRRRVMRWLEVNKLAKFSPGSYN